MLGYKNDTKLKTFTKPFIVFDDSCQLCRHLAGLCERKSNRSLTVVPWTDYRACDHTKNNGAISQKAQLTVVTEDDITYVDEEAWAWLLTNHPSLQSIAWLAQKLGLESVAATTISRSAEKIRRWCSWCPAW